MGNKQLFFKGNSRDTDLIIIKYVQYNNNKSLNTDQDLFSLLKVNKYLYKLITGTDAIWKNTSLFANEMIYKPVNITHKEFYMDLFSIVSNFKTKKSSIDTINKMKDYEHNELFDVLMDILKLMETITTNTRFDFNSSESEKLTLMRDICDMQKFGKICEQFYITYLDKNKLLSQKLESILTTLLLRRKTTMLN